MTSNAASARILLPETSGNSRLTWQPEASQPPVVHLSPQVAFQSLVRPELLDPRSVSDPWSAALAFEWQLHANVPQATELLRLLLLARFEGLVETRKIELRRDGTPLERLLRCTRRDADDADKSLILFLWSSDVEVVDSGNVGVATRNSPPQRVLAASCAPEWTLFPATAYQSSDGLARLTHVLTRVRGQGPQASLVLDGRLEPADADARNLFYGQLGALAELAAKVKPDGPWQTRLRKLGAAQGATSVSLEPLDGLIAPRPKNGTLWICPGHERDQREWSTDASMSELRVDAHHPKLTCAKHRDEELVEGEKKVPLEALGAARITPAQGGPLLVVWSDTQRDPNLRLVKSDPQGVTLCYRLGPRLRIEGRSITLADVCCEPLPAPGPNGEPQATLPIRTEFLALLESSHWDPSRRGWEVRLRGRNQVDLLPCGQSIRATSDSSGVVSWPRYAASTWSGTLVAAQLEGADEAAFVELVEGSSLRVGPYVPQPLLEQHSEHALAFVAFRKGVHERGVLPLGDAERLNVGVSAEPAVIALDFGTSNSVVSYGWLKAPQGDDDSRSHDGTTQAEDTCRLPHRGTQFIPHLIGQHALFTEWHERPRAHISPLVSTLLVDKLGRDQRVLRSALVPRDPEVISHLEASAGTRVHEDLKWQNLEGVSEVALHVYLERLLLPVFRDLAARGAPAVRVAATFPLAFDTYRTTRFQSCLTHVLARLAEASKIKIESPLRLYSESHAGMRATSASHAEYSLTIDMGGGTTDVAVFKDNEVLVADSLRIGGRVLLAALMVESDPEILRARLVQRARAAGSAGSSSLSAATLIEALLQAERLDDVVAALGAGAATRLAVRQALTALLAAIVVSAARLLQAAVKGDDKVTVNLYLLGQGWKLFDARLTGHLDEARFIDVLMCRLGARFDLRNTSANDSALARKLKMVDGALAMLRAGVQGGARDVPVFMGLDFRLKNQTLAIATRVTSVEPQAFAVGDPGFAPVIDELLETMELLGEGAALGDPKGRLQSPVGSRKAGELLLDRAFQAVERSLDSERRFTHSPLTTLLSGPWADFWLRRA